MAVRHPGMGGGVFYPCGDPPVPMAAGLGLFTRAYMGGDGLLYSTGTGKDPSGIPRSGITRSG